MLLIKETFRKDLKFETKLLFVLISIIPLLLVTGPFLPDLILTISVIIFIYISIKQRLIKYYTNPFFLIFTIFWLIIVSKSIYVDIFLELPGLPGEIMNDNPYLSLKSTLPYIRFALFVNCIIYLINSNKKFIYFFGLSLISTLLLVIFDGLFQYLFHFNILGESISHTKGANIKVTLFYITGFFGDEKILGSYLARLLPLSLFFICIFKNSNINKYYLKEIFLLLVIVTIFLTTERVGIALCLITLLLTLFTSKEFYTKKNIFIVFAFLFFAVFFLAPQNTLLFKKVILSTLEQVGMISGKKNINDKIFMFSQTHQGYYKISLAIFFDNIFFGSGVKMFRVLCNLQEYYIEKGCNTHPHHTFIQILSENGLFIFILFSLVFAHVVTSMLNYMFIIKNKTPFTDQKYFLLISFFLVFFPFVPSGNFYNNWLSIIYYIPVGFYLSDYRYFKLRKKNDY